MGGSAGAFVFERLPGPLDEVGLCTGQKLHGILKQSKESLTEDVVLKTRLYAKSNSILKGRQIIWMMLDYFEDEPYPSGAAQVPDIECLKWMGDEKLQYFYKRWEVVTTGTGMLVPLDERIICDIFLERIRPSKEAPGRHP